MSIKDGPKETTGWPSWMLTEEGKPAWIEMKTSHNGSVRRPVQCDDRGMDSDKGMYWKIKVETI